MPRRQLPEHPRRCPVPGHRGDSPLLAQDDAPKEP
jgi:hypothetical protein